MLREREESEMSNTVLQLDPESSDTTWERKTHSLFSSQNRRECDIRTARNSGEVATFSDKRSRISSLSFERLLVPFRVFLFTNISKKVKVCLLLGSRRTPFKSRTYSGVVRY